MADSLNSQVDQSQYNMGYITNNFISFLEKKIEGKNEYSELSDEFIESYTGKLQGYLKDSIIEILSGLSARAGVPMTEGIFDDLNLVSSTYNDIVNLPERIQNYAESVTVAVQVPLAAINAELYGRSAYLIQYMNNRKNYSSPDDQVFQIIQDYNIFAIRQNSVYSNFLFLLGSGNWYDHIDELKVIAEDLYLLKEALGNASSSSQGGNESGGETGNTGTSTTNSGTCGPNAKWYYDLNGTLVIYGTGGITSSPWLSEYQSAVKHVMIGEGITGIGNGSFCGCAGIEDAYIPESVTSIGDSAFNGCTGLTEVYIPAAVKSIGICAFSSGSSNRRIARTAVFGSDPNGITFGNSAFYYNDLTVCLEIDSEKYIPASWYGASVKKNTVCSSISREEMSEYRHEGDHVIKAFGGCGGGTRWYLSDEGHLWIAGTGGITSSPWLSEYQSAVKHVMIGEGITGIGNGSFCGCAGIEDAYIPESVTSIGDSAFNGCTGLTEVYIPAAVKSIGICAFSSGSSNRRIARTAVFGSDPNGITFGNSAFYYNDLTVCLEIDSEKYIPASWYGASVKKNTVCSSISREEMSEYRHEGDHVIKAFGGCGGGTRWYLSDEGHLWIAGTGGITSSPWLSEYQSAVKHVMIGEGITGIGNGSFCGCAGIEDAYIPESVTSIGDSAFNGCTGLTEVYIPAAVKSIGICAFSSGSSNRRIARTAVFGSDPNGITFGNSAFYYNDLTVYLPYTSRQDVSIQSWYGAKVLKWIYYNPPWTYRNIAKINSNSTIIELVREYCSDDIYAQLDYINNTYTNHEVAFKKMQELFLNYGITDVQEGIHYLSNTTDKRYAYLALTNDDLYCANNYYRWLHDTAKGTVAQGVFLASNLLLNGELNDYLSFSTYVESDYPGVKKYKTMLYDFMDVDSASIEKQTYVKFLSDVMNNWEDYSNVSDKVTSAGKTYIETAIYSLNQTKTPEEARAIIDSLKEKDVFVDLDENGDGSGYHFVLDEESGFGKFAELMGKTAKSFKFAGMAYDDIIDILSLDAKLKVLAQYRGFLTEIQNATEDLPFEMRWAASLILDELDSGPWGEVKAIFFQIFENASVDGKGTTVDSFVKKKVLTSVGASSFSAWLGTVGVTSYFIDKATGIGTMLKKESTLEAYCQLAGYYKKKLENAKANFKVLPNEANAWEFYENYCMLYQMRYKGEEAYLSMTQGSGMVKELGKKGYQVKEDVVKNTLNLLSSKCQFTLSEGIQIPESVQYASKQVISCPVDVEVYSANGNLITVLKDGIESDLKNRYGRFAVVYDAYSGEYVKVICENNPGTIRTKIITLSNGLVAYETADSESSAIRSFDQLPVESGDVIEIHVDQAEIDSHGDGENITMTSLIEKETIDYIAPESIEFTEEAYTLNVHDLAVLETTILPANATNKDVEWISEDESVVLVSNGIVEAVGTGETNVIARLCDSLETEAVIHIVVDENGVSSESDSLIMSGTSLILDGTINMNYYVQVPEYMLEGLRAEAVLNGKTIVIRGYDAVKKGEGLYAFKVPVPAKEYKDIVTISFTDRFGNPVSMFTSDGRDITNGFDYSVYQYLNNVDHTDSLKDLCSALDNYGGYAQIFFDHNADSANVTAINEEVTVNMLEAYKAHKAGDMPEGLVYKGCALILESETTVRQYFDVENGHDIDEYSFYTDGSEVLPEYKETYKMYYIDVKNVPSNELHEDTALTAQKDEETVTIYYSPYSYVRGKLNSSSDESLKNLCRALYLYGEKASEYFQMN